MMFKTVLAVLVALPIFWKERDQQAERDAFLRDVAAPAIVREAKGDRELAAFVIAIGWHETKFSPRLAESRCEAWECDPRRFRLPDGRRVLRHQARGSFQLQRLRAQTDAEWAALLGPGSFDAQVREATRRARGALQACRGQANAVAKSFGYYGGRGCAELKDSAERVATYERTKARL